ncbi:MAG TPA: hypothetical protein PKD26_07935 [Pyrinomonadaceae bacterium]|nr:hypothetical protein [Pyrinomonadaceae bacterium]
MTFSARLFVIISVFALSLLFAMGVDAQTRKTRPKAKATVRPVAVEVREEVPQPQKVPEPALPKRNERPAGSEIAAASGAGQAPGQKTTAAFRYEFSQPDFSIPSIVIEHDEAGLGSISFRRQNSAEIISDPIVVSASVLEKINRAIAALNFLDSQENYQYSKDFSHLGNIKFARSKDGRSREVLLNWTENKEMKAIMNEYRKLGHQFIWVFDISVSRENQPLEAPKLMRSLDSMMARNDISDPVQLEPLLVELSNDERIPLIARNHAARLVKQIEKSKQRSAK